MSKAICVFSENSMEYNRLLAAAALIQAETGKICKVGNTFFDAGQGWSWTTILMESDMKAFPFVQILYPKQQEDIVYGSINEWLDAVKSVIEKTENRVVNHTA